jgi:hypothetical protein
MSIRGVVSGVIHCDLAVMNLSYKCRPSLRYKDSRVLVMSHKEYGLADDTAEYFPQQELTAVYVTRTKSNA